MVWQPLLPFSNCELSTRCRYGCCGEKYVIIDVTQLVGALVSILDALAFLSDFDRLSDPSCCSVRFTADDYRLVPVDNMIFSVDVVCDRWFIVLCQEGLFPCTSGVPSSFLCFHLFSMLLHPNSKAASRLSNVDSQTVFAWNLLPVESRLRLLTSLRNDIRSDTWRRVYS